MKKRLLMEMPSLNELNLLHANICQALGDPKRILILYAIHKEPRHVTALAASLGFPQSTVSRHLRVLRQRDLVRKERIGPAVVYHLVDTRIVEILDSMRLVLHDAMIRQSSILA
jgi:DNA-binding transcriptional ArsR family regulator